MANPTRQNAKLGGPEIKSGDHGPTAQCYRHVWLYSNLWCRELLDNWITSFNIVEQRIFLCPKISFLFLLHLWRCTWRYPGRNSLFRQKGKRHLCPERSTKMVQLTERTTIHFSQPVGVYLKLWRALAKRQWRMLTWPLLQDILKVLPLQSKYYVVYFNFKSISSCFFRVKRWFIN